MKTKEAIELLERFNEYATMKFELGEEKMVIPYPVIEAIGIVLLEIKNLTLPQPAESK